MMSKRKHVSKSNSSFLIVTPSYNQVKFLEQSIESVLSQKNIKVKYWVIDGGSNDASVKILKKYEKKINWISEKDNGQTDAINKGIEKAKKEKFDFFAYINSDDYYFPGTFERVAEAFSKNPEKMWLVGDCQIVNEHGKKIQGFVQEYKKLWRKLYQPWVLHILNPIPQPAVFLRFEVVKNIGSFEQNLRYVMDYQYWLRVQKKFGQPIFLQSELAAFRIHHASKGGTQFTKQFSEELQVVKHFTKQPVLLFFHTLHNWLITSVYWIIK